MIFQITKTNTFKGKLTEEKINFEKYRVKIMGEITDKQNLIAHQSRILINEQEKWKTTTKTEVSFFKDVKYHFNLILSNTKIIFRFDLNLNYQIKAE